MDSQEVDVLIVGAGPTGLMAATTLARLGFHIKIIDQAAGPTEIGRSCFLQARTCEILDQMGIADQVLAEAYATGDISLYEDGKHKNTLKYSGTMYSEFPYFYMYGQANLEEIFIRDLKKHGVNVSRSTRLVDFEIREESSVEEWCELFSKPESYPVFATLINNCGEPEAIFAKYIIGTDGAHSFVRKKLALDFEGVSTAIREAVIDTEFESDMPNIENIMIVNNKGGSIVYIPRGKRNGHLYSRFYISLPTPTGSSKRSSLIVSEDTILDQAKQTLAPYTFIFKDIEWFYIYEVAEHVASSFNQANRAFMAGDSCHSHSTKGGMAINLAISDSHNLCWKLFWYEKVRLGNPTLLDSYTTERRAVAQEAIDITARLARLTAGVASTTGINSSYIKEINYIIMRQNAFIHGCGITYDEGNAIMKESDIVLGGNFKVVAGQRAPFGKLVNSDGETVRLYRLFTPDNVPSRFTLLILLNSITEHLDEFTLFAEWVENFRSSLGNNTTVPIQSLLGVIVAQTEIVETSLLPRDQLFHDKNGELREKYGASDEEPAIFVIRPDGYIGTAWLLSEISGVETYFKQILNI